MNAQTFETEFAKLKPQIAADLVDYVERTTARLVAAYTWGGMRKALANAWGADAQAYRNIRNFWNSDALNGGANPAIARDYLAKKAAQYADDQVDGFVIKLTRKLGQLTNVEVLVADTGRFECNVRGNLGERRVHVVQDRKLVVNSHGTWFHQWPALIYVDGKRTTEAAFKALSSAGVAA
jgi:hypothetical protein